MGDVAWMEKGDGMGERHSGVRVPRRRLRHGVTGVTLVELMVTVAVLAILLAVALPAFGDFMEKARLRGAADALSSQFALARAQAMRTDRNVTLAIEGEDETWCSGARQFDAGGTMGLAAAGGEAACDCATTPAQCMVAGEQLVVASSAHEGVLLLDADGTSFVFDRKTGSLVDLTPQTLQLRAEDDPDRFGLDVVTTPMGHARTCIPDGFPSFGGFRAC